MLKTEGGYFPVIVVRKRTFRPWRCKGDSQTELMGFAIFWLFRATRFLAGNRFQANFKSSFFVHATFYFNYLHLSSRASVDDANFASLQMQNQITRNVENVNWLDWIFCEYLVLEPVPLVANFWRNFTYNKNKTSAKNDDVDLPSRGVVPYWNILVGKQSLEKHLKIKDINLNQTVKCSDEEWKKVSSLKLLIASRFRVWPLINLWMEDHNDEDKDEDKDKWVFVGGYLVN